MMIGHLFLVTLDLTIQLFSQSVDRRVHVPFYSIGVKISAGDVNGGLGLFVR